MRALLAAAWLVCPPLAIAAEMPAHKHEGQGIVLRVEARTADQIEAFYGARGFPEAAVNALRRACLMTVGFVHRRDTVLWLEPARWRFVDEQGRELVRLDRAHWSALWEQLDVPAASRATFGWTQLPERRDLHPNEPVGGNVALAPVAGPFRLEARFATGPNRDGPELTVSLAGLRCASTVEGRP